MKKKIICGIVAAILFAAVVAGVIWCRSGAKEKDALEIAAGAGEELVYATINRVTGNDIEVTVLDEQVAKQMLAARDAAKTVVSGAQSEDGGNTERGGMPDMSGASRGGMPGGMGGDSGNGMLGGMGGDSGSGMPDMGGDSGSGMPGGMGGDSGNGMPGDMGGDSGNGMPGGMGGDSGSGMPEIGGGMPDMGGERMPDMSEGNGPDGDGKVPGGSVTEEKTEITTSYRIPVGTDVITSLGATTTFSHLEEGDTIAILKKQDSDTILKIWMIL